jgi:hypothetical protein
VGGSRYGSDDGCDGDGDGNGDGISMMTVRVLLSNLPHPGDTGVAVGGSSYDGDGDGGGDYDDGDGASGGDEWYQDGVMTESVLCRQYVMLYNTSVLCYVKHGVAEGGPHSIRMSFLTTQHNIGMEWKTAASTAFGMSFLSMATMEAAENATELLLTGYTHTRTHKHTHTNIPSSRGNS